MKDIQQDQLSQWYCSEQGKTIAAIEASEVVSVVNHFMPFRCLELGVSHLVPADCAREKINVASRFFACTDAIGLCVEADYVALPFASESFDLVVCAHVHELIGDAAWVIDELSRVLIPEGLAIFVGFNPHGLWRRQLVFPNQPWQPTMLTPHELQRIARFSHLYQVCSDYFGYGIFGAPSNIEDGLWSICQQWVLPSSSILYKTVLRKRLLAKTAAEVTAGAVVEGLM